MKVKPKNGHEHFPDPYHDAFARTTFGFWLYLLSDLILFGMFFASYAVLGTNDLIKAHAADLFHLPAALNQTLLLLTCSFTAGLGGAFLHRRDKKNTIRFFVLTFLLGAVFWGWQCADLIHQVHIGNIWSKNAFLSAYFTLVGTFSAHVLFALLWVIVLLIPVIREEGISHVSVRRLTCLKMFWQFLSIVWIFVFCFIYLLGV